jgi:hypothetical protein
MVSTVTTTAILEAGYLSLREKKDVIIHYANEMDDVPQLLKISQ